MLRFDRKARSLTRLSPKPLPDPDLLERTLQTMIRDAPNELFEELGEELLQIGEEVQPTEVVDDRIDVLAIDGEGALVVIELKHGAHKLQLLQSLAYAAVVSGWESDDIVNARAKFRNKTLDDASDEIDDFLAEEDASLNSSQRIILIADEYDYEVLVAAKWLSEKHDIDISCWKMELAADRSAEYLSLACVYPPTEIADVARPRRPWRRRPARWKSWEQVFAVITNPTVTAFYKARVAEHWPSRVGRRRLDFEVEGKKLLLMYARKEHAYLFQKRRFDGDEQFWREKLGPGCKIDPLRGGRALRLVLVTDADFDAFWRAYQKEVVKKRFLRPEGMDDDQEDINEVGDEN